MPVVPTRSVVGSLFILLHFISLLQDKGESTVLIRRTSENALQSNLFHMPELFSVVGVLVNVDPVAFTVLVQDTKRRDSTLPNTAAWKSWVSQTLFKLKLKK
jgi:hypothetical protein